MEIKDILAIVLSSAAFILSLISTIITLRQKSSEMSQRSSETRRTVRDQLNQIIAEIIDINAEAQKIWAKAERTQLDNTLLSILNQKNFVHTRQAVFLFAQEPTIITDVEYAAVASSLASTGDYKRAEDFWKKAIEISSKSQEDMLNKVFNLRGYADFLYRYDDPLKGETEYQKAIISLNDVGDANKYTRGYTYRSQMLSELFISNTKKALDCYEEAKRIFNQIGNITIKANALQDLETAKGTAQGIFEQTQPNTPEAVVERDKQMTILSN